MYFSLYFILVNSYSGYNKTTDMCTTEKCVHKIKNRFRERTVRDRETKYKGKRREKLHGLLKMHCLKIQMNYT